MTKNKNRQTAFSLIELSIVILIIGIIIAGVTQASRLVRVARLKTAQNLTTNSPITSIKDLSAWYETSLEKSFISTEASDATNLSTWYDINPQSTTQNNLTQTGSDQPKFYENVFGAIPSVRFDGTEDCLLFSQTLLLQTNYTIFVVEQRRDSSDYNYFFGGTSSGNDQNFHVGYRSSTQIKFDHYGDGITSTVFPAYNSPTPRTHTFWFSQTYGMKYYTNGGSSTDAVDATKTNALTSYPGARIGRYGAGSPDDSIMAI